MLQLYFRHKGGGFQLLMTKYVYKIYTLHVHYIVHKAHNLGRSICLNTVAKMFYFSYAVSNRITTCYVLQHASDILKVLKHISNMLATG